MKFWGKLIGNQYFWLSLIIALGFSLRVYRLASNPAGFFCDEAAIGFNAYKILMTGKDEYGVSFPFFFRSFGDYRNPLPIYLNVFSVALFGLNEFAIRFTAAFLGSLTILTTFLLAREFFSSSIGLKKSALISCFAALFLAISPWHIHFSRFGSEYIYFPFFLTLSFWLFLKGRKNNQLLLLSFLFFGLSLYTYYPAWLIVPLFTFGLVSLYWQKLIIKKNFFLFSLLIFTLFLLPLLVGIKNSQALTRWRNVSLGKQEREALPTYFVKTYLAHFSPEFLFIKGDIDYPGHFIRRFSIRGVAELYLFQLPLIALGFLFLLKRKKKEFLALLWLLLLYPLGSSLTGTDGGGPFAFRSIIGVIPLNLVAAYGVGILLSFKFFHRSILRKVILIILIIISLFSLKKYFYLYHHDYPFYSQDFWGWQYGPREVMDYFLKAEDNYDELFLMGDFNAPKIFIKFYDPQNLCQNRCQIGGLEKLNLSRKQLYAIGASRIKEIPSHFQFEVLETIYYPNQNPAFFLGEIKAK